MSWTRTQRTWPLYPRSERGDFGSITMARTGAEGGQAKHASVPGQSPPPCYMERPEISTTN